MLNPTSASPPSLPSAVLNGPLFEGVPPERRRELLSRLPWFELPGGTVLFQEGEPGEALWILLSGTVTLTRETAGGDKVELDRARTGDAFGELAVLSPASRFATATTLGDATALRITRKQLKALLAEREPASEALLRYLTQRICRRLRQVDSRIALVHDALAGASEPTLRRRALLLDALGDY